mmetsp:Transcript_139314/g.242502  ORF Transcript_139314/g.242502 Transcript_139314/m.242502 type:complete len:259 (+) Transcript_139314:1-777(+)
MALMIGSSIKSADSDQRLTSCFVPIIRAMSSLRFVLLATQGLAVFASPSPVGSCGATASPDCINDMASCGNACCSAEFTVGTESGAVYDSIVSYLNGGGKDGLFAYVGGVHGMSGLPADWVAWFQGTHTTFIKKYVDTLNFALRKAPGGGTIVRIFSVSDIAGALGDMGQNRRTISIIGKDLEFGDMTVLFGCGSAPSMPASAAQMMTATAGLDEAGIKSVWIERAVCIMLGAAVAFVFMRMHGGAARDTSAPYVLVA